jgi:hypothetical protein
VFAYGELIGPTVTGSLSLRSTSMRSSSTVRRTRKAGLLGESDLSRDDGLRQVLAVEEDTEVVREPQPSTSYLVVRS